MLVCVSFCVLCGLRNPLEYRPFALCPFAFYPLLLVVEVGCYYMFGFYGFYTTRSVVPAGNFNTMLFISVIYFV